MSIQFAAVQLGDSTGLLLHAIPTGTAISSLQCFPGVCVSCPPAVTLVTMKANVKFRKGKLNSQQSLLPSGCMNRNVSCPASIFDVTLDTDVDTVI